MNLGEFKRDDIVEIAIYDCMEGMAVVREARDNKIVADWICYTCCYFCQSVTDTTIEVTTEMFDDDIVCKLELIERPSRRANAYKITSGDRRILRDSYKRNKKELNQLRFMVKEHGRTEQGLEDASESYEQGWNNALEFVFELFGISRK